MRYSNLHTHTTYSDGKHTIRENIESAIDKQMLSIGISDHSYTDFDLTYCIKKEDIPRYMSEIQALREEYADRIEVYLGLELDGYASLEDRELYDYVIGDCHYVPTVDGRQSIDHSEKGFLEISERYFDNDNIAFAKRYYETYAERIPLIRPDILGHFDLVTKFGCVDQDDPRYRSYALEALVASLEVCPIVEMNTGAIARGHRREPYPAPFLLDEIKARGGRILLSSDSHDANNLTFFFDECVELLRENGFRSIVALSEGRFKEFGI
ncbi:MAG: histidinol-phosphatase HisJ family protein [Clostridia bacterium]|nr:histidinol-phosphatase HisJ family protein [Clostridia bacterium]